MRAYIFLILTFFFSLNTPVTYARSAESEQTLNEFYQKVWSPYCKGNSLLECPSSQAEELRDELGKRYEAGASLDELRVFLKQLYGDQVRMEPENNLRGLLAYLIPWLAFMFVAVGLYFYWQKRIRPRKKSSQQTETKKPGSASQTSNENQKEIEEELRERLS